MYSLYSSRAVKVLPGCRLAFCAEGDMVSAQVSVLGKDCTAAALLCAPSEKAQQKKPTKLSNLKITGKGKVMFHEHTAQLETETVIKFTSLYH